MRNKIPRISNRSNTSKGLEYIHYFILEVWLPINLLQAVTGLFYAGKAIPPESRKGGSVNTNHPALLRRIKEHAKSIDAATNLNIEDFSYRYLAVVPVWITLAERFLIEYYKPVWNLCLDGFGNHDPGSGRRNSRRSWWDTLHPGREWASRLTADKKQEDAEDRVRQFLLASRPQEEKSDE